MDHVTEVALQRPADSATVRTSRLSCKRARKTRILMPAWDLDHPGLERFPRRQPTIPRPISLDVRCRLRAMTGVERWPRSGIRLNWSNM